MSRKAGSVPGSEQLQVLENVMADTPTPAFTRRAILQRGAVGVAAVGALGVLDPGLAFGDTIGQPDPISAIGTTAVTAEAFAVTYLTALIGKVGSAVPGNVAAILEAADAAEQDHFQFLSGAGFKPLTTQFWIPTSFFGPGLTQIAAVIEAAETLFVNAYLIGVTTFALAQKADLARYAGEILGVESEHRTLARYLQGDTTLANPPNNVGFEAFTYQHEASIVSALQALGVGFGQQSSAAGSFYTYSGTGKLGVTLTNNQPDTFTTPGAKPPTCPPRPSNGTPPSGPTKKQPTQPYSHHDHDHDHDHGNRWDRGRW